MIITIFGATGMVGKQLVNEALLLGHKVKAFGRNVFDNSFSENDNLELLQGALFDGGQVRNAIKGSDAVISAIGGAFDGTDKSRSLGMKNIVEQMEKSDVKRIIALGGMGVLEGEDGELLMDNVAYPTEYIPVGKEHLKAYEFLKRSNLEWTFFCAPDIIDAEAGGEFLTAAEKNPAVTELKIKSGDLALAMLKELNNNQYVKQRVGISNVR